VSSQVAIVHGDPNKAAEPFVIRIKSPAGNRVLPVHWHEFDENITVLSGVWCVGTGDKIDPSACTDMPAGSYIFFPKHMHHWAVTKDSVVEAHGIGPFRAYLVQ
jgi:quercetin dioxygenase-like cupin family protein